MGRIPDNAVMVQLHRVDFKNIYAVITVLEFKSFATSQIGRKRLEGILISSFTSNFQYPRSTLAQQGNPETTTGTERIS